jgi:tRNA1Val (adenine37-N6)-methyltransferase
MSPEMPVFEDSYRGWRKPGPHPPGAKNSVQPGPDESLDALSGHFRIFQLKGGHRYSTDDVLVAWYGSAFAPRADTVLELGSGIGSVGMIAAWRLPGARFVTVEAQDESIALARRSVEYNGLTSQFELRHGDFRTPGLVKADERFDLVLGSPPYFPEGTGPQGDHPQKRACRFELRGGIEDYCAVAARHLAPGGAFACVFPLEPPHQKARALEAARAAGLAIVRSRPVALKEGEAPLLGLFLMSKQEDLPQEFRGLGYSEPELVIRLKNGQVHPEYSAVKMSIGFPP